MKRKDLVKMLNALGWTAKRTAGSHEVFVHPRMTRPIPLPMHGADVPERDAKEIIKQAKRNLKAE